MANYERLRGQRVQGSSSPRDTWHSRTKFLLKKPDSALYAVKNLIHTKMKKKVEKRYFEPKGVSSKNSKQDGNNSKKTNLIY